MIISPSVEQVREFKVLTGVFSAEFGRGAGVISVSTKSGTNALHGTAFEYLRDDAFDARNFFVRKTVRPTGRLVVDPKPPLNRHQYGAAAGGPLVIPGLYDGHSRTFFFTDYAGLKREARPGVRQHGADRAHAHWRLQRLQEHRRHPDPHLRPAHHQAQPGVQPGASGQRHEPAVPARSSIPGT